MESKKVLLLGGTGAMGVYVIPALLSCGYKVDVVSLDNMESNDQNLTYIQANALDDNFVKELLKNRYDGCIDFLMYGTEAYRARHKMMLENIGHYVFLSSYRVYAGETPITEESPRLLDVSTDERYLATDDYSLYKAREEDIIRASGYTNYTLLRPSIVFSKRRFQLVTLEAHLTVERALRGKTVILPEAARNVEATMTWAGDVAKMMARILFNPVTFGEAYTVATAEHRTWETIAGYYEELIGMKTAFVDTETYIKILTGHYKDDWSKHAEWQLDYDRLFHRVVDNSKILSATGLTQTELTPLKEGLRRELTALPKETSWGGAGSDQDKRMDAIAASLGL